ncbi:hypothetical protein N9378_00560 [Flavobacteriaceae bacterium]|nr:hypothetical protein [Flavobacteriaceae bacterium]
MNSIATAYNFGQLGSAYSDIAQVIVPPKDMVIVAITFLAENTPTILTPEKLDRNGPGCIAISGSTGDHVDGADNNYFNFNGVHSSEVADANIAAGADVTLETVAVPASKIGVGQYVLLVNGDADESGATAMVIDAETPTPIYKGPNQRGVKVTAYDGVSKVKLDADITPTSSQALVFLDEQHGAGGITVASQEFPAGLTIYGRWTAFKPSAAGAIAYFGY